MNFESFRNTKSFNWSTYITNKLFFRKKLKSKTELFYWKIKKFEEKQLTNHHYEFFFTKYFDLDKSFYNDKKIMDIGCGPRGSLEWADNTLERYGLDPLANSYLKIERTHQMKYVQGISEDIPFEENYFDIISSFNSLDHVDDIDLSIKEITRVLKPGGLFLLISDIHDIPTLTEPSAFSWDIMRKFELNFKILSEKHFEGHQLYKSIREGVDFDHKNETKRYGVLTSKMEKKKIVDYKIKVF